MNDAGLLDAVPEYIQLGGLLKASAHAEGDRRILYLEASNEGEDYQSEVVLQKALADSSDYFMRHGNIDIDHYTLIGLAKGIPDHMTYEIGKPCEVSMAGKSTFVKAELYRGDSALAKNATMVWDSMTRQSPPCRWYPSVGGSVLAKSVRVNPETQARTAVVEKVRWSNIALTRTPVNKTVAEASLVPAGMFAKSMGGFVLKTLTAGYGTDSATLTGGSSLREQSLLGVPEGYWDFRERISKSIRDGRVGPRPNARALIEYSMGEYHMPIHKATEHVEHFLHDLHRGRNRRRAQ